MNKLRSLWEKISDIGTERNRTEISEKHLRLCNQIALVVTVADLMYVPLFIGLGFTVPGLLLIVLAALYALPLLLNARGHFTASRICALVTITVGVLFYGYTFGRGAGLQYILFASLAMSWALFEKKEQRYPILVTVFNIAAYYFIETEFAEPDVMITADIQRLISFSMIFTSFALASVFIYRLILENASREQLLLQSNTALHEKTRLLRTSEHELQQRNEELLAQSELIKASEEELRASEEELRSNQTSLEELIDTLEEKNKQVEQANQYKSEFLSNMSHELRTPLNSILILARLLSENKQGNLNEKQLEFAQIIAKSGNNLLSLINDVLDLAKIESGKSELNIETFTLERLTLDQEELFDQLARQKAIEFIISKDFEAGTSFTGDKSKIDQVLRNLLSNAFKFTGEQGQVSLSIGFKKDGLTLIVQDSGIGIPDEQQELIFDAFKQADGSVSRKYGGTGLGLSITRELVKIMNGQISLQSQPGTGSVFTIRIPDHPKN